MRDNLDYIFVLKGGRTKCISRSSVEEKEKLRGEDEDKEEKKYWNEKWEIRLIYLFWREEEFSVFHVCVEEKEGKEEDEEE